MGQPIGVGLLMVRNSSDDIIPSGLEVSTKDMTNLVVTVGIVDVEIEERASVGKIMKRAHEAFLVGRIGASKDIMFLGDGKSGVGGRMSEGQSDVLVVFFIRTGQMEGGALASLSSGDGGHGCAGSIDG